MPTPKNTRQNKIENLDLFVPSSSGILSIDLTALEHNYHILQNQAPGAIVAGVVKANAYGVGAPQIAVTLYNAGCRWFFVAQLAEAIEIKKALGAHNKLKANPDANNGEVNIAILNGVMPDEAIYAADAGFLPVLNSLPEIKQWAKLCQNKKQKLAAILQCDTGMSRLGLDDDELDNLLSQPALLSSIDVKGIMSHLACADAENSNMNKSQLRSLLTKVETLKNSLSNQPFVSLSASGGIALGQDFLFDLVRPGLGLYGVIEGEIAAKALEKQLQPVVKLEGRVLRIGKLHPGETVGYGASFKTQKTINTATIAVGYADGWLRCLSNKGAVFFDGLRLPIIGRISMDCMVVDISALDNHHSLKRGDLVELIGNNQTLTDIANQAGTIPYEILTSLGHRFERRYIMLANK